MADPMDYTMDEGHGHPTQMSNTAPQCQYQQPPNSNGYASQSRDAHHYDPVHNTESWHGNGNGNGLHSRPGPPYAGTVGGSQWATPTYGSWQGFGEAHRGQQGPDVPPYHHQPGYMGMPHSPWGETRGYEPHSTSFGYVPGMYGENSGSNGPNTATRSSLTASTHSQGPPSRRYPTVGHLPDDFARRATRTREDTLRTMSVRLREQREAAGLPPNPLQIPGSYNYLHSHSLDTSHPRRHDNPDWDSEDDDDLAAPDSEIYTNPYRAGLIFNSEMDDERRIAAMRGATMAARKSVPSKELVASLEKVDPKDLKEADRTCMICYNEFGIQNPDGVVEQPIRLPKCKHVFGDKCIKKWFEDSDSCPYCRDKLPSEPVHRKHTTMDHLYHSRRAHIAAAQAAQVQNARARAGYPSRASDAISLETSPSSNYFRHSQEEYHYIMRGSGTPDTWSYSPPNRSRESENRRRQARGRASLGRPTSVGSARLPTLGPPNPQNIQRAHLQSITQNTLNSIPATAPRRSITPGLTRLHSTGSVPTVVTPPRSRLSEASSSSSEEVSPPVAIGSGIGAGDRNSPPRTRSYREYGNWSDPYASYLTPNEHGHFAGRPQNSRVNTEHSGQSIVSEGRSPDLEYSQRHGEFNFSGTVHEGLNDNRWSR